MIPSSKMQPSTWHIHFSASILNKCQQEPPLLSYAHPYSINLQKAKHGKKGTAGPQKPHIKGFDQLTS